jgi:DNA-binding NtrC family response regulator
MILMNEMETKQEMKMDEKLDEKTKQFIRDTVAKFHGDKEQAAKWLRSLIRGSIKDVRLMVQEAY